jgi:hypothetical protein
MHPTKKQTAWYKVILEKLIVACVMSRLPAYMEPEGAIQSLQVAATIFCPKPDKFNPHVHTLFL